MTDKLRFAAAMLICLHGLVVVVHAISHAGINVWADLFSSIFIGVVIVIAPLVALYLLYTRWLRWGALLLVLAMLGSLLFGVWEHFVLPGADNIASTQPGVWQLPFRLTAVLLALIEFAGTFAGVWLFAVARRVQAAGRTGLLRS